MNNPFGPLFVSPLASFAWTILFWQSTLWLALGLVVSRLWRGHAARAHLLLMLAMIAAVASPLLTVGVRGMGWGFLPAPRLIDSTEVRPVSTPPVAAPQSPVVKQPEVPVAESTPEQVEPTARSPFERSSLPPTPASDSTPKAFSPTEATPAWTIRMGSVLPVAFLAAWLLCSLALAFRVVTSLLAGRRMVRRSVREEHLGLQAALGEARRLLSVLTDVSLCASSAARCPMIWCWGSRPVLLVPPSAADQSGISWCSIFCHELAHWLRRDHLSALWTELLVIALPWQPLAWLSRRQLSALRERACDDWVLASIREATDYAASLVNLVPQNSPTFALPALRSYESLKRRLEHVLAGVRVTPRAGRNWIALASLVSFVAAAGIAFAQQRSATARTVAETSANAISPDQTGEIKLLPTKEELDDLITVRGQVLTPDGRPAAGARVSMRRQYWTSSVKWRPFAAATADAAGRFELSCRPSQFLDENGSRLRYATIAAQADGFGIQCAELQTVDPFKPLVLRLVPEFPIRGRIVDLEGRPVEGVRVRLHQIRVPKAGEDLGPWLEAVKLGAMTNAQRAKLGTILPGIDDDSEPPILTDRDGHFTFRGIGADRDVRLELQGETIASQQFDVATREMQPLKRNLWFSLTDQVFGASFTIQAAPTMPIVGTVRDRATGRPLPGVRIESEGLAGMLYFPRNGLQTKTDAEGKFRLVGLPKLSPGGPNRSSGNVIGIIPNEDQPYFSRKIAVPDSPGLQPVRIDVDLRRGQWVTGRVTDKSTGKPVVSRVEYFPLVKNPYATLTDFDPGRAFHTGLDGTYRLLALPGRAIVGVTAVSGLYRPGVGASAIADVDDGVGFQKYINNPTSRFLSALKEIDPAQGAETANCDFAVDPGGTIHVSLVDRAGQPVSGASLQGESGTGEGWTPVSMKPTFDVINLAPRERRTIEIYHRERQIGKHLVFTFDEKTPWTMTVTLEPCATLVGRLVDADGVPVRGIEIHASPAPGSWPWLFTPIETSRADGRFECRGLYPGCKYDLAVALPHGITIDVQFLRSGIEIEPGKVINLGDVKLKRAMSEATVTEPPIAKEAKAKVVTMSAPSEDAAKASDPSKRTFIAGRVVDEKKQPIAEARVAAIVRNDDSRQGGDLSMSSKARGDVIIVRGQVLRPDGQPAVGAEVFALYQSGPELRPGRRLAVTWTDANGSYQLSFQKPHVASDIVLYGNPEIWSSKTCVIANQAGLGPDAARLGKIDVTRPVNLKLVPDTPIQGRLLDLEGRPVSGAAVEIRGTWTCSTDELKRFLASTRAGLYAGNTFTSFIPPYDRRAVTTDAEGRFQITGVGKDRRLLLAIRGETIAYSELTVVTQDIQPMDERVWPDMNLTERRRVVGPSFTFSVPPTRVIAGVVRDARDRKPLAGVWITSDKFPGVRISGIRTVSTKSDTEGHFRLVGMPKGSGTVIDVFPDGQPYFPRTIRVPDKVGGEPISLDIDLHRGIWITGRVTDKLDGSPQLARIAYFPLRTNPYAAKLSEFVDQEFPVGPGTGADDASGAEGTYRILGVPGPALIGAWCTSGDYRRGVGFGELKTVKPDSDGRLRFAVFSNGSPGPSRKWPNVVKEVTFPAETAAVCDLRLDPGESIQISVLDADGKPATGYEVTGRTPSNRFAPPLQQSQFGVVGLSKGEKRVVLIHDAGRHIGKALAIEFGPQTPRSMTVRLERCATIVGRGVDGDGVPVGGVRLEPLVLPMEDYATWMPKATAGQDGRFRHEGVLPGVDYQVNLNYGFIPTVVRKRLSVKPGETIDLGDVKVNRTN